MTMLPPAGRRRASDAEASLRARASVGASSWWPILVTVAGGCGRRRRVGRRRGASACRAWLPDRGGRTGSARSRDGRRRPGPARSGACWSSAWWSALVLARRMAPGIGPSPVRTTTSIADRVRSARCRADPRRSACTWPSTGRRLPAAGRGRDRGRGDGHRGDGRGGGGAGELRRAAGHRRSASGRCGTPAPATSPPTKGARSGLLELDEMDGIEAIAGELGATATIDGQATDLDRLRPVRRRARRRTSERAELRRRWTRSCSGPSWPTTSGGGRGSRAAGIGCPRRGAGPVTVTGIGAVAGMGFELDPGTLSAGVTRDARSWTRTAGSPCSSSASPTVPTARRCWWSSASASR